MFAVSFPKVLLLGKKDLPILATIRREARKEMEALAICAVAFACHCLTLKSSLLTVDMMIMICF